MLDDFGETSSAVFKQIFLLVEEEVVQDIQEVFMEKKLLFFFVFGVKLPHKAQSLSPSGSY